MVFSEARLCSSHFLEFVEDMQQDIPVPPFEFILPILRLRHTIHVVHEGSDLQPLTVDELSLVEEIMSGKFTVPSAKDALRQRKGDERKRKQLFPDTSILDNRPTAGLSAPAGSSEPSLANSLKKTKSNEVEGFVSVNLLLGESMYSDPSFEWSLAHIYQVRFLPLIYWIFPKYWNS